MSRLRLGLVLLAGLAALRYAPLENLPPAWQARYVTVFGEPGYTAPPPATARKPRPFDLDAVCPPEGDAQRRATTIAGVAIEAVDDCVPDNPYDVAVAVLGGNNVPPEVLMQSRYAPDAVEKSEDRDGDGDPDLIHIRLEVMELNGRSPDHPLPTPGFEIAPGINPGFWVFAPKTRGMTTVNFESNEANRLIRLPAPAIRVEQGDEVHVTLENTHYLPHTIHFHGVDHPFQTPAGEGNDGVPLWSEHPTAPGQSRTYEFTPRRAGTSFYHCHVQPHTHILMGLQGLFIVAENRPDNTLQTFNIGGGRVRAPGRATREEYAREYDLHYVEVDRDLNNRIQDHTDPRLISRSIHREYNITRREAEYFLLNGRSFPYTLRESIVVTAPGERARLRVLNGGSEGIALHFHGHKPSLTHRDGVALAAPEQRDVFWIAPAQRADIALVAEDNGLDSYGEGAWLLHDHREQAVTTDGIGPGGDVSLVVYESFLGERGLPKTAVSRDHLALFFDPDYYRGRLPVFSGMGMPELDEPAPRTDYRRFVFWGALMVMVAAVLVPRAGRRPGR
ncbi:MAG: multicopper oxidase domain-containing protein [Gammaproteobacteria bacterium]